MTHPGFYGQPSYPIPPVYPQQPPARRGLHPLLIALIAGAVVFALLGTLIVGAFAASSVLHTLAPQKDGYLYVDSTGVSYLKIHATGSGQVGGTLYTDALTNVGEQHNSFPVTGVVDAQQHYSLVIHGWLGVEVPLEGALHGNTLDLSGAGSDGAMRTIHLRAAYDSDYNAAVAALGNEQGPQGD